MPDTLIEAYNITKRYGERTVLHIDRLAVRDGERIGLIGENGAGKSTLLSILAGSVMPDSGTVRRFAEIAVIRQQGAADGAISGQYGLVFRAQADREGLSGGELTRRRIASALSSDAALLLADEPTTDLDAEGVALLKEQLSSRRGALMLISHDRYLLNALCDHIWQLEDGHITEFPGGYDAWEAELAQRRNHAGFVYEQYRAELTRLKAALQRQTEWAQSVRKAPKRMGNSEARLHTHEYTNAVIAQSHAKKKLQNRIERLEVKQRPRDLPDIRMALGAAEPIQARFAAFWHCDFLRVHGRTLLHDTDFRLPAGKRTALVGPNGCGKTTLIRTLLGTSGRYVSFTGEAYINPAARIGVFDQDYARLLDPEKTVLENAMAESGVSEAAARTVLARLNLPGDQVFKPARVLSGGERVKAALAKLMLGDCNLLILDEPTNHMDVYTLRALQELLSGYAGTLLFISHDRAFTDAVATRLVSFEGTKLRSFEGTLSEYEAEKLRDRSTEAVHLELAALEMRMAELTARMSKPRKGDRPDLLNAEYERLSQAVRDLKNRT